METETSRPTRKTCDGVKAAIVSETDLTVSTIVDPYAAIVQASRVRASETKNDGFPCRAGKDDTASIDGKVLMSWPPRRRLGGGCREERCAQVRACRDRIELEIIQVEHRYAVSFNAARPPNDLGTSAIAEPYDRVLANGIGVQLIIDDGQIVDIGAARIVATADRNERLSLKAKWFHIAARHEAVYRCQIIDLIGIACARDVDDTTPPVNRQPRWMRQPHVRDRRPAFTRSCGEHEMLVFPGNEHRDARIRDRLPKVPLRRECQQTRVSLLALTPLAGNLRAIAPLCVVPGPEIIQVFRRRELDSYSPSAPSKTYTHRYTSVPLTSSSLSIFRQSDVMRR